MIFRQLLLQFVLIGINALFASTEMAFVSVNEGKLKKQAKDGDKKAQRVIELNESPTGMLSAIQIGITLAGFLGSAFAADSFSEILVDFLVNTVGITSVSVNVLDSISVIIITIILSYFTLILGELVPKRIAMKKADSLAKSLSGFISVLCKILSPFVWVLSASTNIVLKLFGMDTTEDDEAFSEDDIRILLDEGKEQGAIDDESKEMIENVFDLDDIPVSSIMVHRRDMTVIYESWNNNRIIQTIKDSGYSRFPVCGNSADDVTGILLAKEFLLHINENKDTNIKNILHPVKFVTQNMKAKELLEEMRRTKGHMALLADEHGGVSGLITLEDLIEEIVGNIYDETDDVEEENITNVAEGKWLVSAETPARKVRETLGVTMQIIDEYTSFSGFIFENVPVIPSVLTDIEFTKDDIHVKVINADGRKIRTALVEVIKQSK